MTLQIREATLDDGPQMATLAGVLGYTMAADEMSSRLRQVLARPDEVVLVADGAEGQVAGWTHAAILTLLTAPRTCEIQALVVGAAHRRLGVGRALVAAVEGWSRRRGVITLNVRSNIVRPESHLFYPRLGYVRTKTQHVYRKVLPDAPEPPLA